MDSLRQVLITVVKDFCVYICRCRSCKSCRVKLLKNWCETVDFRNLPSKMKSPVVVEKNSAELDAYMSPELEVEVVEGEGLDEDQLRRFGQEDPLEGESPTEERCSIDITDN